MTCKVVLKLIDNFDIDWETKFILVLHSSTNEYIGGTSAELLSYERMSVKNLLYAMMLPSGNDAAQTLAIFFGNFVNLVEQKGYKISSK
jgi:D-alanyl-D-alanine carboxypeptidase